MNRIQLHTVTGFYPLILIFISFKIIEYFNFFHHWFLVGYLEDLLALPLILGLTLIIMRSLVYKKKTYTLSPTQIIYTLALVSVLFEFLLPLYSKDYVQDFYDLICYSVGSVFFALYMNR